MSLAQRLPHNHQVLKAQRALCLPATAKATHTYTHTPEPTKKQRVSKARKRANQKINPHPQTNAHRSHSTQTTLLHTHRASRVRSMPWPAGGPRTVSSVGGFKRQAVQAKSNAAIASKEQNKRKRSKQESPLLLLLLLLQLLRSSLPNPAHTCTPTPYSSRTAPSPQTKTPHLESLRQSFLQ